MAHAASQRNEIILHSMRLGSEVTLQSLVLCGRLLLYRTRLGYSCSSALSPSAALLWGQGRHLHLERVFRACAQQVWSYGLYSLRLHLTADPTLCLYALLMTELHVPCAANQGPAGHVILLPMH